MWYFLRYFMCIVVVIVLTGCESVDGFMDDLDGFEEQESHSVAAQGEPILVLPKISQKPIPPVSIKPKIDKKNVKTLPEMNSNKSPECVLHLFERAKTISDFYTAYYKNPKECPSLEYYSIGDDATKIIVGSLRMQDVRLLNADVAFATFMFNIIKQSNFDLKKISREMIAQKGCGLLGKMRCMALEASLIEFDN